MGKICILGSNGFIGSNLKRDLIAAGKYNVLALAEKDCDLLSPESLDRALSSLDRNDVIIMVSAVTRLVENSFDSFSKNVRMVENLAGFLRQRPIKQVIFFSTVDVYGLLPAGTIIQEALIPNPNDYYAISKITGEYILKKACLESQVPLAILRLSGIYGPNDQGKSTINKLIESARMGKICVFGNGSSKRDFVLVNDLVRLINEVLLRDQNMLLNVATGQSYSIKDIVEMIRTVFLGKIQVEFKPEPIGTVKRIDDMIYDISEINRLIPGFKFTALKEGIGLYLGKGE